jgi:hypothetical protein
VVEEFVAPVLHRKLVAAWLMTRYAAPPWQTLVTPEIWGIVNGATVFEAMFWHPLSLVTVTMYETGLEILMVIDGLVCPELQE